MRFFKSDRIRFSLQPLKDTAIANGKRKREEGDMPPPTRITFKQSKSFGASPSPSQTSLPPLPKLHIPTHITLPPPTPPTPGASTTPVTTPGGTLKLKLKIGQQK